MARSKKAVESKDSMTRVRVLRSRSIDCSERNYELRKRAPTPVGFYRDKKTQNRRASSASVASYHLDPYPTTSKRQSEKAKKKSQLKPLKPEKPKSMKKPKTKIVQRTKKYSHFNMQPLKKLFEQIDTLSCQDGKGLPKGKPAKNSKTYLSYFPENFYGSMKNKNLMLKSRGNGICHLAPETKLLPQKNAKYSIVS